MEDMPVIELKRKYSLILSVNKYSFDTSCVSEDQRHHLRRIASDLAAHIEHELFGFSMSVAVAGRMGFTQDDTIATLAVIIEDNSRSDMSLGNLMKIVKTSLKEVRSRYENDVIIVESIEKESMVVRTVVEHISTALVEID